MKKRLLGLLLMLVMVMVIIPAVVVPAEAGTYAYCFVCGQEDVVYCEECERCLYCESLEFCSDCEVCDDCIDEDDWCDNKCGNHLDCQGVDFTDCLHYCYDCAEGSIFICSDCNLCEQCVGIACEECQRCTECVDRYSEDCIHCSDCYHLCEMCDLCAECESLEYCRSCGYCENCVDMCPNCYEYCADCITVCEDCGTCVDCVEDFCWDCNRCSECVDVCTDCGEYCADCVTICEDCGACENCVGDEFCASCGFCSECAYICEDCCEVCEYCADAFCTDCNSIGSCCEEICARCGLCDVCVTVCPDCQEVCDNCGTLCNVCHYCEDCCICSTLPQFIVQPKDGEVVNDDGKAFVSWRTNFEPKKLVIMKKGSRVVYANLAVNKRTYELGLNEDPGYIVRAYYGTGENEYVDSNVFYVKKVAPRVTLCDEIVEIGGETYLLPGETFKVSWELNFTPVRQYIEHDGEIIKELDPAIRTYNFQSVSDGGNYVIVAYYNNEKFMTSDEFFIYAAEFAKQPVGGTVEEGEKLTVNWNTSFSPAKLELISYSPDGSTETTILPRRDKTVDVAGLPAGGYYQIRAYFTGSRYVDSDKIYVEAIKDPVVTFLSEGAQWYSCAVQSGATIEEPADPAKEGYNFIGWYTDDGDLFDFETPITEDITLTAKFGYTVLFWLDPADEYAIAWRDVEPGQTITEQAEPGQEGKVFLGWFTAPTGGTKFDFSTPVNGNLNLYARFVDDKDGWVEENGKWYFYENGVKVTGWLKDGTKWYYMDANGAMLTGWQKVDGKWYYLNNNMKTGWQQIGGKWYYLGTNGAMTTGWQKVSGKWYYMNANGVMQTGWQKIDGKWYYLNSEMKTGWQKISGKWYYLNNEMKTGWQQIGGKWYYLGTDGAMQTGWIKLSGKWYYLNSNGVMVTGTQVIDGKTYKFNSNGVWIS